jgi:galactose mutarotase-like enzyme
MISLENDHLKVWIKPKGAELKSLVNKSNGIEHMWDSDPKHWAKSSPVLFPIVGGLKENTFKVKNDSYSLPRHGFAREMIFNLESKTADEAVFFLSSNEETLKVYPYSFIFKITYKLVANELSVTYQVENTGKTGMLFSVGAHPAFAVPFDNEEGYDNFYLEFEKDIKLNRWPLNAEGLIGLKPTEILLEDNVLPLTKKLFEDDALVFKDLKSESILLKSKMSSNYLKFNFKGFPYFGIWAAKNANFVCLEPWCGIADSENHNQELTKKEGMNKLAPSELFERTWSVEVA